MALQHARRDAIVAGRAPDVLWTLEHPAVVTLGRRGGELRAVPDAVDVVRTDRGGLATVHVPGQLVGYLVADLAARRIAVHAAVTALELGLIDGLARLGVSATQRAGARGVWVGDRKIAAIGLHVRRGVTTHGFALNLHPDLRAFEWIVPCGLVGAGVTSVQALNGCSPSPWDAAPLFGSCVVQRLLDASAGHG